MEAIVTATMGGVVLKPSKGAMSGDDIFSVGGSHREDRKGNPDAVSRRGDGSIPNVVIGGIGDPEESWLVVGLNAREEGSAHLINHHGEIVGDIISSLSSILQEEAVPISSEGNISHSCQIMNSVKGEASLVGVVDAAVLHYHS